MAGLAGLLHSHPVPQFHITCESVMFCCLCFSFSLVMKYVFTGSFLVLFEVTFDSVCVATMSKLVLSTSLKGREEVKDETAVIYMWFFPRLMSSALVDISFFFFF